MKKRVLLISPHPDDIVLSLGCMVNKIVQNSEIYIWDVFTIKTYNKCMMTSEETTEIIKREEMEAWESLGIHIVYDDFVDAQLRYNCRASQIMDDGVPLTKVLKEESKMCNELESKFCRLVQHLCPDYVGIPLGVGKHIDHLIIREIVLEAGGQYCIFFYEDMPYSMSKKWYEKAYQEVIQRIHVVSFTCYFSTDDVCKKICLLKKYKSQFTRHEIKMIEQYQFEKKCERIWFVKKQGR